MKKLLIVLSLLFSNLIIFSQDIIRLKNGTEIQAKVIEIGSKEIKYKKYNFIDGPDYILLKKEVDYIIYENGMREGFYGKYSEEEYRRLCERKVKHYVKQQKAGLVLGGIGLVGFTLIAVDNYNYNINYPNNNNYDRYFAYQVGYFFSAGAIAGGAVLYLTGKRKTKQYSEKLRNISLKISPVGQVKTFSAGYRF